MTTRLVSSSLSRRPCYWNQVFLADTTRGCFSGPRDRTLSSCPNLRLFVLIFDATKLIPPMAQKPGGGVCNINITTLHARFSPIEPSLKVAVTLSAILPRLGKIRIEFGSHADLDHRDERVAKRGEALKCIGIYTLIRKQEGLRV